MMIQFQLLKIVVILIFAFLHGMFESLNLVLQLVVLPRRDFDRVHFLDEFIISLLLFSLEE